MRYILALFCPPLAMVRSGKPIRAIASTVLLILAALTWTSGLGMIPAALSMIWACRTVGETYATEELEGFLRLFNSTNTNRL